MDITSGLKLNVNKIKSPFGSSSAIPKISAGGGLLGLKPQAGIKPSSILTDPGTLVGQVKGDIANIDRTIAVEKRVSANEKKITILKKILQNQKESGNRELAETNDILKDIGNALALDFASRIQDSKDRLAAQRRSLAAQRRRDKEEGIEGKDKIDKDKSFLSKTFDKVTKPAVDMFGKIIQFFSLLGAGILAKGAFTWLKNPENLDKVGDIFKWLGENWKWLATAVAIGGIASVTGNLLGAAFLIKKIWQAVAGGLALMGPLGWKILAVAALTGGASWWLHKTLSGGEELEGARKQVRKTFREGVEELNESTDTDLKMDGNGNLVYGPTHPSRAGEVVFTKNLEGNDLWKGPADALIDPTGKSGGNSRMVFWSSKRADGKPWGTPQQIAWGRWRSDAMAKIGTVDTGLHGDMWDAIRAAEKKVKDDRKAGEQGLSGSTLKQYRAETKELIKMANARVRKEYQVKLNAVIDSNPGNLYGGGTVIGPAGIDNIVANLTAGEEVITNQNNIASNFRTHLKEINDNGGKLWLSLERGVKAQSRNSEKQAQINARFNEILVGFNTKLANMGRGGGGSASSVASRSNISAVPKQIGGVLVKPRRNIFVDMPLQQSEIDARTVKENVGLQRQEELLVKSRAGRMGSDIEIGPYDPSNEYWVAQAYDSYGFPGWSDLL